jgi:peroxiredoxin
MKATTADASALANRGLPGSIPAVRAFMDRTEEILRASGFPDQAIRVGDRAPDFALPDAYGDLIRFSDLLRTGPVALIFYRGAWCSICMRQLRDWQDHSDTLERLGAKLIAISPEAPERLRHTADAHRLSHVLLSDPVLHVARAFNVAMSLPPELVDLYSQIGADAAVLDEEGRWELPVPATFLVGRSGRIRFARVDLHASRRTGPEEVISAIGALRADAGQE